MTITVHILLAVSFRRAFHYNKALWSKKFLPHLTFKAGSPKRRSGTAQPPPKNLPTRRASVCESDTLEVFHHSPCCIQVDSLSFKAVSASPGRQLSTLAALAQHIGPIPMAVHVWLRGDIRARLCFLVLFCAAVGHALDVVVTVRSTAAATARTRARTLITAAHGNSSQGTTRRKATTTLSGCI